MKPGHWAGGVAFLGSRTHARRFVAAGFNGVSVPSTTERGSPSGSVGPPNSIPLFQRIDSCPADPPLG